MQKLFLLWITSVLLCMQVWAQNARPIVQTAEYPENLTETNGLGAFAQDTTGFIYLGFSHGVLEFDGKTQNLYRTPEPALALAVEPSLNRVFVACPTGFGYLKRQADGNAYYISLSEKLKENEKPEAVAAKVKTAAGKVYFQYPEHLFIFDTKDNQLKNITIGAEDQPAGGLVVLGDQVFVQTAAQGFCKLEADKLTPFAQAGVPAEAPMVFATPFDDKQVLIGMADGALFLFDGQKATPFAVQLGLRNWVGAARVGENVVLATGQKGCYVVNEQGQVVSVLDVVHGLAETDIFGAFGDRNGLLWLAHRARFAWLNPNVPLNRYSEGIYGKINDIEVADKPYIATDEGVYKLTEFRSTGAIDADKVMNVLEVAQKTNKAEVVEVKPAEVENKKTKWQQMKDEQREKKGLLGKVFKKKSKKELEAEEEMAAEQAEQDAKVAAAEKANAEALQRAAEQSAKIQSVKKVLDESKKFKLQRADFVRIVNLPELKYTDLAKSGAEVLAASVGGLYAINDVRGELVSPMPARKLLVSQLSAGRVYALPLESGAGYYQAAGGKWAYLPLAGVSDYVNSLAEDAAGALWLGTDKGVLRVSGGKTQRFEPDTVGGHGYTRIISLSGVAVAVQNGRFYRFTGQGFEPSTQIEAYLSASENLQVFDDRTGTWALSGRHLYHLVLKPDGEMVVADSSQALGFAGRVEALCVAGSQIWAGSGTQLFQLNAAKLNPKAEQRRFSVDLRRVTINGKPYEFSAEGLELPAAASYDIQLSYAAPSFENHDGLRFQYRLDNEQGWKTLDGASLVRDFPYGDYELAVRAIDAYGNISTPFVYKISIATPFWARWWFGPLIFLTVAVLIVLYFVQRQKALQRRKKELEDEVARQTVEIRSQRDQIQKEKDISENLLLNILPKPVAEELKKDGKAAAKHYDRVSVLFTDFKGFTNVAEKMSPADLLVELDRCFAKFDEIIDKHGLEKIKTIGDAYMCAGGVPIPNLTNAVDVVLAGLEFQQYMREQMEVKKKTGDAYWELRLGVHTGPLVAGVVGKKKFAYDVWGDTVNTASRMESSGEPNRVNISGDTYELVKDFFVCTYRGKVSAKNKGEIDMYFVESIKPELSVDGKGVTPNEKFKIKVLEKWAA